MAQRSLPNSGEIHTLPATSSWLVYSRDLRYSRSIFSSSAFAQGNAILNIPVALTKPSLLLRYWSVRTSAITFLPILWAVWDLLPSRSKSLGVARGCATGKSQTPSGLSAEEPEGVHTRKHPSSRAWSHSTSRPSQALQRGWSCRDDGAREGHHLQ